MLCVFVLLLLDIHRHTKGKSDGVLVFIFLCPDGIRKKTPYSSYEVKS
jgi:hypothetical protein